MLLVNVPVPVPFVVFESAVVGFCVVLHQTPRADSDEQPSEVTFPELDAVVGGILVTSPVVIECVVELSGFFVGLKDNSFP